MSRSLVTRLAGRVRQRESPPAPRLAAPTAAGTGEPRVPAIFVIGCQRSGTSLVRRILDSHSRIACPPESRFILPVVSMLRDTAALRGLSGMGYERDAVTESLGAFVASFFQQYAKARAKPRWADKTPQYVDCLPELWELFGPEAKFVVVIRHGMDVARSLADPNRHYPAIDAWVAEAGGDVPVGAARFWAERSDRIEAFREHHADACHVLRYEDLTVDPEPALRPMFEFLGEPWEPDVVDFDRFPHHGGGFEDPDVRRRRAIEPNSERWREWPEDVQDRVRAACSPMLERLGYG